MTIEEIVKKLIEIFNDSFDEDVEFDENTSFKDLPEWDSFIQITIIFSIESEFGIRFKLGELDQCNSIIGIARHILEKQK